jgi:hypothetical protein
VGVDEGLVPGASCVILDLNNVGQGSGTIVLSKVLEGGRVLVVFALEFLLGGSNSSIKADSRLGVSDFGLSGCKL